MTHPAKVSSTPMDHRYAWELEQSGVAVAQGDGPIDSAHADARHYATVYNQDGPVTLYRIVKGKRQLELSATKGALLNLMGRVSE